MRLDWTRPALADIADAGNFISQNNPQAAVRMSERVREAVEYLLKYPNIGRPGRVPAQENL